MTCMSTEACEQGSLPGSRSDWRGYDRSDFLLNGSSVTIVRPMRVADGKPWVWRARFFDHRPDVDLALLDLGFHVVFLEDTDEALGSPAILKQWDALYRFLVDDHGLARKVALEGLSRGGLYVYNWAAANPDKVACIYADAPVCDIRSWPAGKGRGPGDPHSWQSLIQSYGFGSEEEALAKATNPIDHLKPLADARIPLLHICGDADEIVPPEENTRVIQRRYEALGGQITVITRKGIGHEHGLPEPSPIVDFIVKHAAGAQAIVPPLRSIRRIVFLGDSITYDGRYIQYVEAYLLTRYPDRQFELINLGLPSETASGLSEPGHADGQFARPCVHDRLTQALAKSQPDLVVICYGMNDGIYMPFDENRFARYQKGMRRVVQQVQAAGAQVLVLTPPVFDPTPLDETSDEGGAVPYRGYDDVLQRFSQWLLEQRQNGWAVADVHDAMVRHIAARRADDARFILAADGVHANAFGHWLMSRQVLAAWGVPAEVGGAQVDVSMLRAARGNVTGVRADNGVVSFAWQACRPTPVDPQWDARSVELEGIAHRFNRMQLAVTGLPAERYHLFEGDTLVATLAGEKLAAGVDVLDLKRLSLHRHAAQLLEMVGQRQRLLRDAWLTDVGHDRPGLPQGEPLDKAIGQADEMAGVIRRLAGPATLSLRLVPAVEASPG
jgi:lysophospholipase L1-like esterase/pimeloyl-ACP methyl ester carboxylesterase